MDIKLDFYENGRHKRIAHFFKEGVHMTVSPHSVGPQGEDASGWEVYFWGDKEGKLDTSNVLDSAVVDGGSDDQEEIADTYARRLEMGIKPKDMFSDTVEANLESMRHISEDIKSEKR